MRGPEVQCHSYAIHHVCSNQVVDITDMVDAVLKSVHAWHASASAVPFAPKSAFLSVRGSMHAGGLFELRLLQDISNLRATVGGGKDQGITTPNANAIKNNPYSSNLVPADSNSLVFARTPTQASATPHPQLEHSVLRQYWLVDALMFNVGTSHIAHFTHCSCVP